MGKKLTGKIRVTTRYKNRRKVLVGEDHTTIIALFSSWLTEVLTNEPR